MRDELPTRVWRYQIYEALEDISFNDISDLRPSMRRSCGGGGHLGVDKKHTK
jgi:hypothetical protein